MAKGSKYPDDRDGPHGYVERYCPLCDEWWPANEEFFYAESRTGRRATRMRCCIACCAERYGPTREANRKAKAAAAEGRAVS